MDNDANNGPDKQNKPIRQDNCRFDADHDHSQDHNHDHQRATKQTAPSAVTQRSPFYVLSIGLLLGILMLQWSTMTAEQQSKRDESIFGQAACQDRFPPPWRTTQTGQSAELMPSIRDFGLPACVSMEFRPSTCNADHFLVRCYAESERKGLWRVYRVELESEEIYSVSPDMT